MQTRYVRVVCVNWVAQAVMFVQNGTLGRACQTVEKVFDISENRQLI